MTVAKQSDRRGAGAGRRQARQLVAGAGGSAEAGQGVPCKLASATRWGLAAALLARLLLLAPFGTASAQPAGKLLLPPDPGLARALDATRLESQRPGLRRRYLLEAHDLLNHYWQRQAALQGRWLTQPRLLFAGDRANGCRVQQVQHPMAFYCPESAEIAMALDLRRYSRLARGKAPAELLQLDLAVLAHEWGHHVNRSLGGGPFRTRSGLTVKQEEQAADWRTGIFFGWLLNSGGLRLDDYTETANLLFEIGDYEHTSRQHHGYPKDRFGALTRGLATQIRPGQTLGSWHVDTVETFSRPVQIGPDWTDRIYEVLRFEIDRSGQIAENVLSGLFGAISCIWGSGEECVNAALLQGKGRAHGRYTRRHLRLRCSDRSFDVSDDNFERQPIRLDGKGQARVLAQRDCGRVSPGPAQPGRTPGQPGNLPGVRIIPARPADADEGNRAEPS